MTLAFAILPLPPSLVLFSARYVPAPLAWPLPFSAQQLTPITVDVDNSASLVMPWVLNADEAINRESQYPTIVIICTVLSVLSIAIVGTRLYIRHTARGLAGDDWMAALSVLFALIYSILCIVRKSTR